jgi:DNA ligase (NAD+)
VELIYQNGVLTKASTRGNGQVGEDITDNIKTYSDRPVESSNKYDDAPYAELLDVRGEVYMELDSV